MYRYSERLKKNARILRSSMTESEVKLWNTLRRKQVANLQFYRQRPLGQYIVDFYCPVKKLVIEVDGGQHYEDNFIERDKKRDKYLENNLKLKVLRFTNIEVLKNINGVIDRILDEINKSPLVPL
jgi:very-short-patch-repair endonuclease